MCISQKIANLLGGKITVKSEIDKGSTFSFYHPIKLGMSGNMYEYNNTIGIIEGNILIVDDNNSNLSLFHMLLDQFNYEYDWKIKIESVDNGITAIELCKLNNYDIIFMDINMIGIDGSTTSKIIKLNGYTGKIVATTGNILLINSNSSDKLNYSFDDVLIKPFDDHELIKILKTYLFKK